jgi:DNA-binding MarR family transcriptional regulator
VTGSRSLPGITQRQSDTYRAILNYKRTHDGCSPTLRELSKMLGLSTFSSLYMHLKGLAEAGLIVYHFPAARSIQVNGATWTPPPERTEA